MISYVTGVTLRQLFYRLVSDGTLPNTKNAYKAMSHHGQLMQVELDALPPDVLRGLYQDAIGDLWDTSAYEDVVAEEQDHVAQLRRLIEVIA